MPKKTLLITAVIVAVIALGATAIYITQKQASEEVKMEQGVVTIPKKPVVQPKEVKELPTPEPIDTSDWKTYRNEAYGFEVRYPTYSGEEMYFQEEMVTATLPVTTKTILDLKKRFRISVEKVPTEEECFEKRISPELPESEMIVINGIKFKKEIFAGDIAAGNVWDHIYYSTARKNYCITLEFILHYINPAIYGMRLPDFDKEKESEIFDQILSTFRFIGGGK